MQDDNALMLDVKAGELNKLALLFERHHLALFQFFRRYGNSASLSEDLVQDTFMRLLKYRHSYNGTDRFKAWLLGVGRNVMADHYRRHKLANLQDEMDEQSVGAGANLSQQMEQQEQGQLFEQALAELPPESREILLLSRFQQLNYEEIAKLLDCNLNTLKARMRKAISLLQQHYQALAGETG